ncbi:MAG: DUF5050 domain-containing protein [Ruminiclostridium sp.]|nr:DUF5050 domain-containing protein [Ruminiclostridium sp.]
MKKLVLLFLSALLILSFTGCGKDEFGGKSIFGSESGNISNSGMAVRDTNSWIYYSSNEKIFEFSEDNPEKVQIADEHASYLNIVRDYLYYSGDRGNLCRIKTDGSDRKILSSEVSTLINVYNNLIFYTHGIGGNLYRIDTNGKNEKLLSKDEISDLSISDMNIFYTDFTAIYKMDFNGDNKVKIYEAAAPKILVKEDIVYFRNSSDNDKLYSIKTDGSELKKFFDYKVMQFNIDGEWIYFTNISDNKSLYKIKIDGSNYTKLRDGVVWNINIIDNWIYFNDSMGKLVRIKNDGSSETIL